MLDLELDKEVKLVFDNTNKLVVKPQKHEIKQPPRQRPVKLFCQTQVIEPQQEQENSDVNFIIY
jgi:hypothetical protein